MSIDFDMNNEYVLLLERGVGVFELNPNNITTIPALIWISEEELSKLGL
jgi:hypothetical protein